MKKSLLIIGLYVSAATIFASSRFTPGSGTYAGCTTDKHGHLIWATTPTSAKYTWSNAKAYVKNLKLCGFNDWRLPNKEEQMALQSNVGNYAPFAWFNTHGFNNIQTDFYWSSETYGPNTSDAWGIFMYSGKVYNEAKSGKNYVWPVRGEELTAYKVRLYWLKNLSQFEYS